MERADAAGYRPAGMGLSDFVKLTSLLLVSSIFALNLAIVRPLKQRLENIQEEMATVHGQMELLVAERDQVRGANDLLSLLSAQRSHIQNSYAAIKSIREFRTEVEAEAARTTDAMASLDRLAELENLLVEQQRYAAPARRVLEETVSMQRLLAEQIYNVEEAGQVLQRMLDIQQHLVGEADNADRAQSELERLSELKRRILSQTRTVEQAHKGMDSLNGLLANLVQETDDVEPAQSAADALLNLKDRLVVRGSGIPMARNHAEQLLDIRDRLVISPLRSDIAGQSLEQLIAMQSKLISVDGSIPLTPRTERGDVTIPRNLRQAMAALNISRQHLADFTAVHFPLLNAVFRLEFWKGTARPAVSNSAKKNVRSASRSAETIPRQKQGDRTSQRENAFGPRHFLPRESDAMNGDNARLIWPAGT